MTIILLIFTIEITYWSHLFLFMGHILWFKNRITC